MQDISLKTFLVPLVILILFIGGIIGIINWQKSKETNPPEISVNLPEETIETEEGETLISGKTENLNKVWINDEEVMVKDDGTFDKTITLKEGENKFDIKAENQSQEVTTITRTIKKIAAAPSAVVSGANTETEKIATDSKLNNSGPEDMVWIFGFSAIIISLFWYFKSRKSILSSLQNNF